MYKRQSLSRAKKKLILVGNLNTLQRPEAHNDYGIPDMVSPVKVFESIATNTKKFSNATDYERFLETNPQIGQMYKDVYFEIRDGKIVFDLKLGDGTMRFSMPDIGLSEREHLDVVFRGFRERDGRPIFYPADLEHLSKFNYEKRSLGFSIPMSERLNSLERGFVQFSATVKEKKTFPMMSVEMKYGEVMDISYDMLWNVGTVGRSYDLVCFPGHRFAFNDRAFKDFTGRYLVNDRIDGVVVSESDFGYFVEIKDGVYGFIAKSYLQQKKKKLICGNAYSFHINRIDYEHKKIQLGL